MKKILLSFLGILLVNTLISQESRFFVHGQTQRSITQERLKNAKTVIDLMPGYPSNWISSYNSIELTVKQDGKSQVAKGFDETLNSDQLTLLKSAELNSEVKIEIKYNYLNSFSNEMEKNRISVMLSVIPEAQAEFIGGENELNKYLKENCSDKISESQSKNLRKASLKFFVNEEGLIVNPSLTQTSGNLEVDKLLIEALSRMPKWKPAEDALGKKVQQVFVMDLNPKGTGGC